MSDRAEEIAYETVDDWDFTATRAERMRDVATALRAYAEEVRREERAAIRSEIVQHFGRYVGMRSGNPLDLFLNQYDAVSAIRARGEGKG